MQKTHNIPHTYTLQFVGCRLAIPSQLFEWKNDVKSAAYSKAILHLPENFLVKCVTN
jgi:hypothetical protein